MVTDVQNITHSTAVELRIVSNTRMGNELLQLWNRGMYRDVKQIINRAEPHVSKEWKDFVADHLQGVKREAFINYMAV